MYYPGFTYPSATRVRPPDTIYLLLLIFVSSFGNLLSRHSDNSRSITELTPPIISFIWSLMLFAGAGIALLGVFWSKQPTAMLIESVGRAFLSPACLAFGAALLIVNGRAASLAAAYVLGLGISSLVRIRHIQGFTKRFSEHLEDIREARENGVEH